MSETPAAERKERNWDAYAATIASLVGLLALIVSGYTAYIQRKQVAAQVWPRLEVMRYPARRGFVATSRGVGPVRMRAVKVTADGRPVRSWEELLRAIDLVGPYSQGQISGRVLSPGEDLTVISFPEGDEGLRRFEQFGHDVYNADAPHHVGILICYCSVLDDCWLAGSGKANTGVAFEDDVQVDRCRIAPQERFRE
jgi:hypothetical protein